MQVAYNVQFISEITEGMSLYLDLYCFTLLMHLRMVSRPPQSHFRGCRIFHYTTWQRAHSHSRHRLLHTCLLNIKRNMWQVHACETWSFTLYFYNQKHFASPHNIISVWGTGWQRAPHIFHLHLLTLQTRSQKSNMQHKVIDCGSGELLI